MNDLPPTGEPGGAPNAIVLSGAQLGVFVGPPILALVTTLTIGHVLYDAELWPPGAITVGALGLCATFFGQRSSASSILFPGSMYLAWVGLMIVLAMIRTFPWSPEESFVVGGGALALGIGYWRLKTGPGWRGK